MMNKVLFDLNQLIKYMTNFTPTSSHRNHLPLITIISIIMLNTLIHPISTLHIQTHQPVSQRPYDQTTYSNELSSIQNRLSTDVNAIKQKFANINMGLANTNISSSDQVIFLQQNIANQRDSLYNIQTYLNVPFALKSCQCVNLTEDQQQQLRNQVETVGASIKALETALNQNKDGTTYRNPNCVDGDCPQVQEIERDIEQMQNYKKILNQTVTSQCCKFISYVYRDNLVDSSNWVYGNLTEQQYRLSLFQASNQQNLTQCPSERPFADLKNNVCQNCPQIKPLFNLETRQCQERCQLSNLVFYEEAHQCDINRTCDTGKLFDEATKTCQVDLGTDSSCPNSRPVWNNTNLRCQPCPINRPYFDRVIRHCRQCTLNEIWQNYTLQCIDKHILHYPCPNGSFFNTKTSLKCEPIPSDSSTNPDQTDDSSQQTEDNNQQVKNPNTFSNCPPTAPFWSSNDFACHSCPQNTPYFNLSTNKCQACPASTIFNLSSNTCQVSKVPSASTQCKINEVYNQLTKKCESLSSNRLGLCPPDLPNWNTFSMSCQRCNSSTPFWNATALKCQVCGGYSTWDEVSGTCKSTLKKCTTGFTLIIATNTCQPIICPTDAPIFNPTSNKCENCELGSTFNNKTRTCDSQNRDLASVCPAQRPYYNHLSLSCEQCPVGQTLNPRTSTCTTPAPSHLSYSPLKTTHNQVPTPTHQTFISHLSKGNILQ